MTRIISIKEEIARIDYDTRRRARLLALQLQLCAIQAVEDEVKEHQRRLEKLETELLSSGDRPGHV